MYMDGYPGVSSKSGPKLYGLMSRRLKQFNLLAKSKFSLGKLDGSSGLA